MAPKHIHFIGICGVAMSALALTFKEQGWKVTGSDVGFFPPVSTHLEEHHIEFYAGWHPENMGKPDLVVVGNVASSFNPEWLYVKENKIKYRSYPEVIEEFFVKANSIVCAGTFGKTTSTALLTWIFLNNGFNPSYMFGGLSQNQIPAAHLTSSDWSILEGDEYKSARWDPSPKFSHYEPKHLLLTAVIWDHADIYKTEEAYRLEFQKLINKIPKDGLLIVSERVSMLTLPKNIITYGKGQSCKYKYGSIKETAAGIEFDIHHNGKVHKINSPCLGEYMADNITACFAMAEQLDIAPEKIIESIKTFVGMKRRLEKRLEGKITIFDDIAHSPAKARSVLETLRRVHSGQVVAVFEPNTGNRRAESIPGYDHCFDSATEVVIPRLTKIKHNEGDEKPLNGQELAAVISQTQPNTTYIDDDSELVRYLLKKDEPGTVIAFLGSHGFRGMIEDIVKNLQA